MPFYLNYDKYISKQSKQPSQNIKLELAMQFTCNSDNDGNSKHQNCLEISRKEECAVNYQLDPRLYLELGLHSN